MKINIQDIDLNLKTKRIVIENIEYDLNGNVIETATEKNPFSLNPGTLVNYMDGEWVLLLEDNGYVCLDYDSGITYLAHNWAEDPYTTSITAPFKTKNEMNEWLKEYPCYKEVLIKYYEKILKNNTKGKLYDRK